ncbi:hypothetical protein DOTSEDRAFT_21950 [Dothistroma septosporum NZE10]|uniref:Uncharacterized protein n=1 Tax=Dothistroma septosporum (strain NZE10 / CBS 128990) TaxID=675120 RepID=N1PXI7_DOTSN|nr:hypothetical protein DOTSEDRAFT_21950 [Dothistroma septosporum NZE10]
MPLPTTSTHHSSILPHLTTIASLHHNLSSLLDSHRNPLPQTSGHQIPLPDKPLDLILLDALHMKITSELILEYTAERLRKTIGMVERAKSGIAVSEGELEGTRGRIRDGFEVRERVGESLERGKEGGVEGVLRVGKGSMVSGMWVRGRRMRMRITVERMRKWNV